jgi:hypothetical protein
VGGVISKIKVDGRVFENFKFVGFGTFSEDGFLIIIEEEGKYYAISPFAGKVYSVVMRNNQFYAEIPYAGGRVYRAPLRFKL